MEGKQEWSQIYASHTGSGVAYPVEIDIRGNFRLSSETANIEESIDIILRTNLGERVYRPDFGSRLSELAFEPVNAETLLTTRLYVEEALNRCEPRITVDKVIAKSNLEKNLIDIEIIYKIKNKPDLKSMVYPFYLQNNSSQNNNQR